ncbi:MAG: bifunctional 5,10-methylenetetrahydrofolate dehydrogenase/5,10-methenyltetrahydrofolate cyclohydrolase [Anaerolineae bacterium]|nr:bifunctional 5,10-methylenetetrahydrofolate dehydrogenase/5,10-methenyltetrahydrofolate cyclohydrolase [Anaerolineae bacterium]
MAAKILDGRELAKTMRAEIAQAVADLKARSGVVPSLAVVRAGDDPASVSYAGQIAKAFAAAGMDFSLHALPESAAQETIVELVARLSADPQVHGIMVQEPLPREVDAAAVVAALAPVKDVDGVHPENAGRLLQDVGDYYVPATPAGGMELLRRNGVSFKGARAVIVGRSNIVGKPMACLLLHQHATVTICHSRTVDLGAVTRTADILVAAVGRARLVTGDMVKPGAIVVDFGVNFSDGVMVGDVDFEGASAVAGAITPVPGGTGPMTNVMLMQNTLRAATRQSER